MTCREATRFLICCLVLCLVCACGGRKGIWVECEGSRRTLDTLESVDAMLDAVARRGFTDLYVQLYRRNRSWFPSELADDGPYRAFVATYGTDLLEHVLRRAHGRGIRVHGWLNVFSIGPGTDQPVIARLGRQAIIVDDRKVSMADYGGPSVIYPEGEFLLDSNVNWLDPAGEDVQRYLEAIVKELLDGYEDLDGIHLDFIRYPYALPMTPVSRMPVGLSFGFNAATVRRFEAETGAKAPFAGSDRLGGNAWDAWRRKQVSRFVARVHRLTRERRKRLSAAVLAWADRAYLTAFQDWRGWLEDGTIDEVLVMNYTRDRKLARQISRQSVAARGKGKVLIGLGAYVLGDRPEALTAQGRDAMDAGADGVVLFSYDAIMKSPRLFDAW